MSRSRRHRQLRFKLFGVIALCGTVLILRAPFVASSTQVATSNIARTTETASSPGKTFRPVVERLDANLATLQQTELGAGDRYNAADVNYILTQTSVEIAQHIPSDDKVLQAYVKSRLPSLVETSPPFVSHADADTRFTALKGLLAKLNRLPSFQVDLSINSQPPNALFELTSSSGVHLSVATNSVLTNVYRGEYEYRIVKKGFKTIVTNIDLIDRAGSTFSCDLTHDSDPNMALPCKFN
jgi:hypothetical protein